MTRGAQRALAALGLLALLGVGGACAGAGDAETDAHAGLDADHDVATVDGDGAANPADASLPDGAAADALTSETAGPIPALTIAFDGLGRFPDNQGERDTWLVSTQSGAAVSLSDLVRASGGPTGGCAHACVLAADGRLAVAAGPVTAETGVDWRMAAPTGAAADSPPAWRFEDDAVAGAVGVAFAAGAVFYSRPVPGEAGVYEIRRRESVDPAESGAPRDERLFSFPPEEYVAGSAYRGALHVSADGATIALDRPTSRSRWLFAWRRDGGALALVDTACWQTLPGTDSCMGASAFYGGDAPIAISRDGRHVVWFVVTDGRLEARHLALDGDTRRTGILSSVPEGGDWLRDACAAREPWQPTAVVGRPYVVDGGAAVLFVGEAACGAKAETDVLELSLDRLGDGVRLAEADVVNRTRTPKAGGPEQLVLTDLALDDAEETLVFTATPAVTADGAPIPAGSSRHEKDSEVWVQRRDGGPARQLTDDAPFTAERPVVWNAF